MSAHNSNEYLFHIKVGVHEYSSRQQFDWDQDQSTKLAEVHLKGKTFCLCKGHARPLPLTIFLLNKNYHLKVNPLTGPKHDENCFFRRANTGGAQDADEQRPYSEEVDGSFLFRLNVSTSVLEDSPPNTVRTKNPTPTNTRPGQQRASLTRLLYFIWQMTYLHRYKQKPITWFKVCFRLAKRLPQLRLAAGAPSVFEKMLFACSSNNKELIAHNNQVLSKYSDGSQKLFVIGRLTNSKSASSKRFLSFKEFSGIPYCNSSQELIDEMLNRPINKFVADNPAQGSLIVLALIVPVKSGKNSIGWKVERCASLPVDTRFTPVDSQYEIQFSDYLAKNAVAYEKPMEVMSAGDDEQLKPDYILLNTINDVYAEVWGMNTPEYNARKLAKQKAYADANWELMEWNAISNAPMPAIPQLQEAKPDAN